FCVGVCDVRDDLDPVYLAYHTIRVFDAAQPVIQPAGNRAAAVCDMKRPFLTVLPFRRVSHGVVCVQQQELICRQAPDQRQLSTADTRPEAILLDVPAGRHCPKLVLAIPVIVGQAIQWVFAEVETGVGAFSLFGHIFPGLKLVFALPLHSRKLRRESFYTKDHNAHPHSDSCMMPSSCLGLSSLAFFGLGTGFAAGSFFGFVGAAGLGAASAGLISAGFCISASVGAAPVSFTFMTNSTSALGK